MTFVYAVVADRDCLAALAGISELPYAGVCIVDGDAATCHLAEGAGQVEELVRGLPCCPSRPGNPVALPSIEAELEALSLLAEEALRAARPAVLPPGFSPATPRMEGGLRARLTDFGLDLAVSVELARTLGWAEGDGVTLGVSPSGLLAVARGGHGAFLTRSLSSPGELHLDRDLSGLPLEAPLGRTEWVQPQYCLSGGAVVLSWRHLAAAPGIMAERSAAEGYAPRLAPPGRSGGGVLRGLGWMLRHRAPSRHSPDDHAEPSL